MATIVNSPPAQSDNSSLLVVGVFLLLAFLVIVGYFGLPLLRNMNTVSQPTQIQVPDKIDVNVQTPQK